MKYVLIFITLMIVLGFTIPTPKYVEGSSMASKDTVAYPGLYTRVK